MIIEILGVALLGNFIAWQFSPIQDLKKLLKLYNLPGYFGKMFYCHICLSFWIGLIFFKSLWLGLACSYLSHILKWVYDLIEKSYEK
jgi:hypothetical protein